MERQEAQPIGEILNQFLKLNQLENQVFGDKIAEMWQETLGDEITLATDRIFLQSGYLFVELKSPSLKNELIMKRTFIKNILNSFRRGGTLGKHIYGFAAGKHGPHKHIHILVKSHESSEGYFSLNCKPAAVQKSNQA